jgi:predicted ester cyclase
MGPPSNQENLAVLTLGQLRRRVATGESRRSVPWRNAARGSTLHPAKEAKDMAAEGHEALIRAYIDEVFNGHRLDRLETYWNRDLVSNWMGMAAIRGLPAWRDAMAGFFAAFPNAAYTLDDMFFAADRGVWRGHWQATQAGEWQGVAASGRRVRWSVVIVGRFAGGRLAEDWVELDRLGLFQQLGCLPAGS